jgi:Bacteriophage HK97-gp10, putative tail-component
MPSSGFGLIKATWKGGKAMAKSISNIKFQFPDEVKKALYQEAQAMVVEMKRRCPVDVGPHPPHPGNLRASIHAELPQREGRRVWVTVATGVQAPYAIYVHEILEYHHPVGQAKFMESVIKEAQPTMNERIAARMEMNKKGYPIEPPGDEDESGGEGE